MNWKRWLNEASLTRWILSYLSLVVVCYTVGSLIITPNLGFDPSFGWMSWQAQLKGAPFCHTFAVDESDMSRDTYESLPYWTPGQHVIPGILNKMGMGLPVILPLLTGLFSAFGLAGFYRLYREFGFGRVNSLVCCAITASTRLFAIAFTQFNGGEVMLFGYMPWMMWMGLRMKNALGWREALLLIVAGWFGIFLKFTALIVLWGTYTSMIFVRLIMDREWISHWKKHMGYASLLGGIWIFDYFFCRFYFPHPMYGSDISLPPWSTWMSVISGPLLNALSLESLLSRLLNHPSHPILNYASDVTASTILAMVACLIYLQVKIRLARLRTYVIWLACFSGIYFLSLISLYSHEFHVAEDPRQARAVALLLLPGMIQILFEMKNRILQGLGWAVILACSLYGLSTYPVHLAVNARSPKLASLGTSLDPSTTAILDYIHRTDALLNHGNNLYYLQEHQLGFDIQNGRATFSTMQLSPIPGKRPQFHGHVDHLVIVLQPAIKGYPDTIQSILDSFVDYKEWDRRDIDQFLVLTPKGQEMPDEHPSSSSWTGEGFP